MNKKLLSKNRLKSLIVRFTLVLLVVGLSYNSAKAGTAGYQERSVDGQNIVVDEGDVSDLIDAILHANESPDEPAVIQLTGTYTLSPEADDRIPFEHEDNTGLPAIESEITIETEEGEKATIQRDPDIDCELDETTSDEKFRILTVGEGATLTLERLTISHGCADDALSDNRAGGGLLNSGGSVQIINSTFSDNRAGSDGGGIRNRGDGELLISDSKVAANTAGFNGGGVHHSGGVAEIIESTISDNVSESRGGGIRSTSDMLISDSEIADNASGNTGGGIENSGSLRMSESTVVGNMGGRNGGGIRTRHEDVNLTDSEVSSNVSGRHGGGLYVAFPSSVEITGTDISGNQADGDGGGVWNNGGLDIIQSNILGNAALGLDFRDQGDGGGIYSVRPIEIMESTLADNSAEGDGGGLFTESDDDNTVSHSTIADNSARDSGGGIANRGRVTVTTSTIANNEAESMGGGLSNASGAEAKVVASTLARNAATRAGGILNLTDATISIKNSIVADSPLGGECDNEGDFTGFGTNMSSDDTCPGFRFTDTDPQLDPGGLADHGGLTETIALSSESPAINAADDCNDLDGEPLGTDQRGVERPEGDACDLGAFEFDGTTEVVVVLDVTVHPSSATIDVGETIFLREDVEVDDPDAVDEEDLAVQWSSSNEEIATVDEDGRVTGVSGGEAVITATSVADPSVSGSAEIEVRGVGLTGILRPGEFTEFEGGLLIGTHPDAIDEPVTVEVEWFMPPHEDTGESINDQFVKINVIDFAVERAWLSTPAGTGFIIGMPVPDEFDISVLRSFEHVYGEFAYNGDMDDFWLQTPGIYDPDYRMLTFHLNALGMGNYPTKLGIVEHEDPQPLMEEEIIGSIQRDLFDDLNNHNRHSNTKHFAANAQFQDLNLGFDIIHLCDGPCEPDVVNSVAHALAGNADTETVSDPDYGIYLTLTDQIDSDEDLAIVKYKTLSGDPWLLLEFYKDWWLVGTTWYQYRIYNSGDKMPSLYEDNLGSDPCQDKEGNDMNGMHLPTGIAWTCEHATDPEGTTRHELFHAIQGSYYVSVGDAKALYDDFKADQEHKFLFEATARLAQDHTQPLSLSGKEDTIWVNRSLYDQRPYRGEHFFTYMFNRGNLEFETMGDLFDTGFDWNAISNFFEAPPHALDFERLHWNWIRDVAFESNVAPDTLYGERCDFYLDAFDGIGSKSDFTTLDLDNESSKTLNVDELSANILRIALPDLDNKHYYEVSIDNDSDRVWVYTDDTEFDVLNDRCTELTGSELKFDPGVDNDHFPDGGYVGRIERFPQVKAERYAYILVFNSAKGGEKSYQIDVDGPHPLYDLTLSDDEGGSITEPGEGEFTFEEGEEVNLLAESENDFQFDLWTGDTEAIDDPTSASTTITMKDDYEVTATFAPERNLEIAICGAGTVELDPEDYEGHYLAERPEEDLFIYAEGDTVQLEAVPNDEPDPGWDLYYFIENIPDSLKDSLDFVDPEDHPVFVTWKAEDPSTFFDDEVDDPEIDYHTDSLLVLPMLEERMGEDEKTREILAVFTGSEPCLASPEPDIPTTIGVPFLPDREVLGFNAEIDFHWSGPGTDAGGPGMFYQLVVHEYRGDDRDAELVYNSVIADTSYTLSADHLHPDRIYFWQVRSIHEPGLISTFTQPMYFEVSERQELRVERGNIADLIDAIATGNNLDNPVLINVSGTYTLDPSAGDERIPFDHDGKTGLPSISNDIRIVGNDAVIQRDPELDCDLNGESSDDKFRLFYVEQSASLTLQNIVIANGCVDGTEDENSGGAILSLGSIDLFDVSLHENQSAGYGGGILLDLNANNAEIPDVEITETTFTRNHAAGSGGGLYLNALEDPTRKTPGSLTASSEESEFQLKITESAFTENTAYERGGAIANLGALTVENSSFTGNQAPVGKDIANAGTLELINTDPDFEEFTPMTLLPEPVTLTAPENGQIVEADTVQFTWNTSAPKVQEYEFQLSAEEEFAVVHTDSTLSDTTITVAGLSDESDYWWRVRAYNEAGAGDYSEPYSFTFMFTSTEQFAGIPDEYELSQNYPNPFNPSTVIEFALPEATHTELAVYNMLGRRVATLVDDDKQAGHHRITFDAGHLASGVYIYRIRAGEFEHTRNLTLIK